MEKANSVSLGEIDYEAFTREIEALRRDVFRSLCYKDFLHLVKMERIGKLCSLLGFATAWIFPNPISAYLIAQGNVIQKIFSSKIFFIKIFLFQIFFIFNFFF